MRSVVGSGNFGRFSPRVFRSQSHTVPKALLYSTVQYSGNGDQQQSCFQKIDAFTWSAEKGASARLNLLETVHCCLEYIKLGNADACLLQYSTLKRYQQTKFGEGFQNILGLCIYPHTSLCRHIVYPMAESSQGLFQHDRYPSFRPVDKHKHTDQQNL